jgi:hypothetical protein
LLEVKYEHVRWVDVLDEVQTLLNLQWTKEIPYKLYFGEVSDAKIKAYEERTKKRLAKFKEDESEYEFGDTVRISLKALSSTVRKMFEDGQRSTYLYYLHPKSSILAR